MKWDQKVSKLENCWMRWCLNKQDLTFFKIWNSELTAFKHYSFKIRKLGDPDIPRLAESE